MSATHITINGTNTVILSPLSDDDKKYGKYAWIESFQPLGAKTHYTALLLELHEVEALHAALGKAKRQMKAHAKRRLFAG